MISETEKQKPRFCKIRTGVYHNQKSTLFFNDLKA
jgi:hypothetical protein